MTDKQKIATAFKELRKMGWFARMNFWCCQSCGCAAIPEEYNNKFVFYHKQDAESIGSDGNIGGAHLRGKWGYRKQDDDVCMYLSHGEGGNTTEIVEVLNKHGLAVEWNGNMGTRIAVRHKQ